MNRRVFFLALLGLLNIGDVAAQSVNAPPTMPGALSARASSATAGAIRWERSTDDGGVVPGYDVVRDGSVLGVFDALSYVDFALAPGTAYRYTVTAIDREGQRSVGAEVTLLTAGDGPDSAGAIAAPTGLGGDVYSSTAAEIFWARPATFGLSYEVRRDGALLGTTNGTSYFDAALVGGSEVRYEVVALDRDGRRSLPAAVVIMTRGGTGGSSGGGAPAAPSALRGDVYSSTAAEIFWDRPSAFGLSYEVLRNGTALATTSGTSYFDAGLSGGNRYRYEVIAIDRAGRRSAPSAVVLATPGAGGGGGAADGATVIAVEGREAFLARLFDLVNGVIYADVTVPAERLLDGDFPLTELGSDPDPVDASVQIVRYACPGGGTYELRQGPHFGTDAGEADGCDVGTFTLDGGVSGFLSGSSQGYTVRRDYGTFSITRSAADRRTITGGRVAARYGGGSADSFHAARYEAIDGAERTVVVDAFSRRSGSIVEPYTASAAVTSPWTKDRTVTIETTEPFARVDGSRSVDGRHDVGTLVARAADGSTLTLSADNGDPASFQLVIEADGSSSAFTVAWSATGGLLAGDACGFSPTEARCAGGP